MRYAYDQLFLGRYTVSLKTHRPSLAVLRDDEWLDCARVARQLDAAVR